MFEVLDEVCTPTKGSKYSACIDLRAREDVVIAAGETAKVPLGVCINLEKLKLNEDIIAMCEIHNINYSSGDVTKEFSEEQFNHFLKSHYLQLEPRSSLRAKGLQAGTGIIDLDYEDEIMIILHNPIKGYTTTDVFVDDYQIKKGDKIAQIMLCEHKTYLMGIDTQEERTGGFGSTGK